MLRRTASLVVSCAVVAIVSGDVRTVHAADGQPLTLHWTLPGEWIPETPPSFAYAKNAHAFLYLTCTHPLGEVEIGDCTASVHALPGGTLVHQTALPRMRTDRDRISAVLSPNGTYFAILHAPSRTRIYESATGRLIARSADEDQVTLQPEGTSASFLDDRRVLTSARRGAALDVTELPSGRRIAHVELGLGNDEYAIDHMLSVDRTRITAIVRHGEDPEERLVTRSLGECNACRVHR